MKKETGMEEIIARLEAIADSAPARDMRGTTNEEIEAYYNTLEAAEDAFLDVVEEIPIDDLCLKPGFLDMICSLAIKEDGSYVDGEDKAYSNYQDRLPFRLYEYLEWWTVPIPKLLMDELRRHVPKLKL